MAKEQVLLFIASLQENNPFDTIFFSDGENEVRPFEGYMMTNLFSTEFEDVIVRFYSRVKEKDDAWRRVFEEWRKKKYAYKKVFSDMEHTA